MWYIVVMGNIVELERYIEIKQQGLVHGSIIDVLIRDVLPFSPQSDLDLLIEAIANKTTKLSDVLTAEPQLTQETAWTSIDQLPWLCHSETRAEYSWWCVVWLRINLAKALSLYMSQHVHLNKQQQKTTHHKLQRFINAHVPLVQYLDQLDNPCDAHIDVDYLCSLYSGLGESSYDEDRQYIVQSRTRRQVYETPLEIIQRYFPDQVWTPLAMVRQLEQDIETIDFLDYDPLLGARQDAGNHKLYYACLCLINQIHMVALDQHKDSTKITTALYFYYLAFVDFFDFVVTQKQRGDDAFLLGLNNTESNSWWQVYYPYDTRAWTIYDCPNLYHVLAHIPLWGKPNKDEFVTSKFLQKSLPFSGQSRSLIERIVSTIRRDNAFHRTFQLIMWCMLVNAYPDQPVSEYCFDMKYLLRCRELMFCDKYTLCETINCQSQITRAKQTNQPAKVIKALRKNITKTSIIVVSAFRLYILYLIDMNPHYAEVANQCINIHHMRHTSAQTVDMIRNSNLYPEDAFARARQKLFQSNNRNKKNKVHRYKKYSCIGMIFFHLKTQMENWIFEAQFRFKEDLSLLNTSLAEYPNDAEHVKQCMIYPQTLFTSIFMDNSLSFEQQVEKARAEARYHLDIISQPYGLTWKENILNYVVRLPPQDRLTIQSTSVLMLERYGNVSKETIVSIQRLISIYYSDGECLPKYFEREIEQLNTPDIVVLVWYFNCLSLVEKLTLVPLDAETVERTDDTMRYKRYQLLPTQQMSKQVYEVLFSVCCKKIKSVMGAFQFGHKCVAYNMDRQIYTCTKSRGYKKRKVLEMPSLEDILEENNSNNNNQDQDNDEKDGERQSNQDQRKDFQYILCDGQQPMLRIDLRGYALIYNETRYQHCPDCGSLHHFNWSNYSGSHDGHYRCCECIERILQQKPYLQCAACKAVVSVAQSEKQQLTVLRTLRDPHDKSFNVIENNDSIYEDLYFCERHYRQARYMSKKLDKHALLQYLNKKTSQANLKHMK